MASTCSAFEANGRAFGATSGGGEGSRSAAEPDFADSTYCGMPAPSVERFARTLMIIGAIVAVLGMGAWLLDVIPPMPEWMIRIAIYKLTLAGGAGLLVIGAFLRRAARESSVRRGETGEHELVGSGSAPVDRQVHHDARDVSEGDRPGPAQVRHERVGAARLPHQRDTGGASDGEQ
jgi:hypothetical protein